MVYHSECEHCEDWDNFRISESGKALREKIYGDGYQDGHKDGYDKGYKDAQANNNRPQDVCKCATCEGRERCSTFCETYGYKLPEKCKCYKGGVEE
jgi:hypothetical protein